MTEAELQAALNVGGIVQMPLGTINTTAPLTLINGTIWQGHGSRTKVINVNGTDIWQPQSANPTEITIRDFEVQTTGNFMKPMSDRTCWGLRFSGMFFRVDGYPFDFYSGIDDAHNYRITIDFCTFYNLQRSALRGDLRFFRWICNDINGTRPFLGGTTAIVDVKGWGVGGVVEQGVFEPTTDVPFLSVDGRGNSNGELWLRGNWDENNAPTPVLPQHIFRQMTVYTGGAGYSAEKPLVLSDGVEFFCTRFAALSGGVPAYDEASIATVVQKDASSVIRRYGLNPSITSYRGGDARLVTTG
jgi:hypothetical protein